VVEGAALEKRCAKAPWVRIPPSPPLARALDGSPARWALRSLAHGRLSPLARAPRSRLRLTSPLALAIHRGSSAPGTIDRRSGWSEASRRGRLVDYGAALEMRYGATHRGFESLPLRHHPGPGYTHRRRARRGTSGALYLQSAPAGLNSLSRSRRSEAAPPGDVEDRVPRSGESRTVSGPEGSSTQRSSSGAAERPGPSRLLWWARVPLGRRRVHGNFDPGAT
jgi:hypothetical protein